MSALFTLAVHVGVRLEVERGSTIGSKPGLRWYRYLHACDPAHADTYSINYPVPAPHTLRSASKEAPYCVATERRPSRPSPSLRTQLMVAAAGRLRCAPMPTAWSKD